jgi:hypothetical protein
LTRSDTGEVVMRDRMVARAARDRARLMVVLVASAGAIACAGDDPVAPQGGAGGMSGAAGFAGAAGAGVGGAAGFAGAGTGGAAGMAGTGGVAGGTAGAGMGGSAGMAGAGAGGVGGMMATGAPTFSAIFDEIFTKGSTGNCMFGACHGGAPDPALNGNLRIAFDDKAGAYAGLVGVVSTSTLCAGMTLVVPGNSQASMLIQKLSATPPCGMRMPIGTPLTDAQVAQIATWIDNGALND